VSASGFEPGKALGFIEPRIAAEYAAGAGSEPISGKSKFSANRGGESLRIPNVCNGFEG